jgi:hypothetical protein
LVGWQGSRLPQRVMVPSVRQTPKFTPKLVGQPGSLMFPVSRPKNSGETAAPPLEVLPPEVVPEVLTPEVVPEVLPEPLVVGPPPVVDARLEPVVELVPDVPRDDALLDVCPVAPAVEAPEDDVEAAVALDVELVAELMVEPPVELEFEAVEPQAIAVARQASRLRRNGAASGIASLLWGERAALPQTRWMPHNGNGTSAGRETRPRSGR